MPPSNNLGTAQGLTGIPSLLLSGLNQVQDKTVQTALYEIQNWANSVGLISGTTGGGTAGLGTNCPAATPGHPTTWTTVTYQGSTAYIPVWV